MRMIVAGFALALFAAPATASDAPDTRWTDWLGCWALVTDEARADGPAPAAAAIDRVLGFGSAPADRVEAAGTPRVCVEPLDTRGVRLTTRHNGAILHEQTIVADGQPHPVVGTCTGTRRAEWSASGIRLFSQADLRCADAPPHSGTSLSLIAPDGTWVDIEAIRSDGRESLQVRRYRRVDPGAGIGRAAAAFTLADVQESLGRVPPAVLEAALVESQAAFSLRTRDVLSLVDGGVPERVIDLMVALSYPDRFVVERRVTPLASSVSAFPDLGSDHWGYYYTPFGYSSADYYHFHDRFLRGGSAWVPVVGGTVHVVEGGGGGGTAGPPPQERIAVGTPAVVNDLGYTRVRPRETDPPASRPRPPISTMTGNIGGGSATASSSGGGGGGGEGGGGGSGGGSVSPQGYSGGGGDTGRTVVPR